MKHSSSLQGVAFLPDGQRVLVASDDAIIYLWDVRNGRQLHRFEGHRFQVMAIAVSTDGYYALSGGMDGTMRLWRLPDPPPKK
jgi:WD40 repeat protein